MIRLSSDRSINSIIIKKESERKKGSKNIYFTLILNCQNFFFLKKLPQMEKFKYKNNESKDKFSIPFENTNQKFLRNKFPDWNINLSLR